MGDATKGYGRRTSARWRKIAMTRAIALVATATTGLLPRFGWALATLWLEGTALLFDGYRPERHYMRGPGPACQAKYGRPSKT
jgi:hypothetical protein